jgi:hypothetical protein
MSVRPSTIKALTDVFPDELPELSPIPEPSSSTGILSYIMSIRWTTWLIIVLILALLGINVFRFLAKGTETTANLFVDIFGPIAKWLGYELVDVTKTTIDVGLTGAQTAVDIAVGTTSGAVSGAVSGAQKAIGKEADSSLPVQNEIQQTGSKFEWDDDSVSKALRHTQNTSEVTPDDSLSTIQSSSGRSGWCFIGEQQGVRTCAELGVNDKCMSGDIFPSQAICVNPQLRA